MPTLTPIHLLKRFNVFGAAVDVVGTSLPLHFKYLKGGIAMTVNQLNYLRYLEDQRANQAQEAETYRANLAKQEEINRANRVGELLNRLSFAETQRSNLAREGEAHRSNVENELIRRLTAEAGAEASRASAEEAKMSAALAAAKTEAQGLQNYISRWQDLDDATALADYRDEYLPRGSVTNNAIATGVEVRQGFSNLMEFFNDLVRPLKPAVDVVKGLFS